MGFRPLRPVLLFGLATILIACSGEASTPVGTDASPAPSGSLDLPKDPDLVLDMPDAVAAYIATNGVEDPIAVWTTHDGVIAAVVDLDRGELTHQTHISDELIPFPHPIERPAATVSPDGQATIAFIALAEGGESVYLTRWDRQKADTPEAISGPPRPETVLVHATTDSDREPVLAWLETATLSVGVSEDGAIVEEEEVDDLTCDCCNPVPVFFDDALFVAYRDFDQVDGEVVRDVVAMARDADSWRGPVAIADDHWFIDACPFSGPSVAVTDGGLVVAWMDARQSVHPDQAGTTIWVDRSEDGADSFGDDLAITTEGIHHWPVMAVDEAGTIHLVWETQGAEGGLSYATSDDGSRTFSDPVLLVERDADTGSPTSPSVIVHEGRLLVSWAAGSDGHIAVWAIGENGNR